MFSNWQYVMFIRIVLPDRIYGISLLIGPDTHDAFESLEDIFFRLSVFDILHNGFDCPAFNYNIPASISIMFLGIVVNVLSDLFFVHKGLSMANSLSICHSVDQVSFVVCSDVVHTKLL